MSLRAVPFIMSDSTTVRSVAEYGIYTGHSNSVLGRNTLLCPHFGWKFSDFVHGNIDTTHISNATLSRWHRGLVSDSDWHVVRFLTDITDTRDGVNSLQFSDSSSLSSHDLNDTVLHLANGQSDQP